MRRRDFLSGLTSAAALRPLATAAQAGKRPLIATLSEGALPAVAPLFAAFRQALVDLGYDDRKIRIESRWADGHPDRLSGLARELIRLSPDVMVALSGPAARALKDATGSLPIVMAISDNPVGTGLVASLAHPGGNVTGLSFAQEDTVGRELQLLKTLAPTARRVAVFANPKNPSHGLSERLLRQAAASLRTELIAAEIAAPAEIGPAFAKMKTENADAMLVLGDGLFTTERNQIIALAAANHLPAIYHDHIFVEAGGLMSYGGDIGDNYRRAAVFVDKILRGTKPADLPIEEPTKLYLYVNRRTAAALHLTIPPLLLAQADKVID
jgi:putative ABC transport system substrate-binding protein